MQVFYFITSSITKKAMKQTLSKYLVMDEGGRKKGRGEKRK